LGGVKRKSLASMEKQQESQSAAEQPGQTEKGKKGKEVKAAPQQQKRLPFLVPRISDEEMLKALSSLKAITVFSASRALGVNASIATGLLYSLEAKKMIRRAGGFSGHYVWSVSQRTTVSA
jgi:small subunit ribosomal protein S25e